MVGKGLKDGTDNEEGHKGGFKLLKMPIPRNILTWYTYNTMDITQT